MVGHCCVTSQGFQEENMAKKHAADFRSRHVPESYEIPIGRSRSGMYVIMIQTGLCARLAVCKWDAQSVTTISPL
jgi:hypothetical protein